MSQVIDNELLLKQVLENELHKIVEEETDKAKENVEKRMMEHISTMAMEYAKEYRVEFMADQFRITFNIGKHDQRVRKDYESISFR